MKVDLNVAAVMQQSADRTTRQISTAEAPETQSPISQDRTTLQSDAASTKPLVAKVLSFPPVRQNRVDALRQSISTGSYKIDVGKIATALTAEAGE
jgi:flagellar biosynthesis anti-sigma factor FlgM